jgi:hypothetical protein
LKSVAILLLLALTSAACVNVRLNPSLGKAPRTTARVLAAAPARR